MFCISLHCYPSWTFFRENQKRLSFLCKVQIFSLSSLRCIRGKVNGWITNAVLNPLSQKTTSEVILVLPKVTMVTEVGKKIQTNPSRHLKEVYVFISVVNIIIVQIKWSVPLRMKSRWAFCPPDSCSELGFSSPNGLFGPGGIFHSLWLDSC